MSCLLTIQQHDTLYMGSDTAVSTTINNDIYRLHNNGVKLYHIDDMVIFCSGNMDLAYSIMEIFMESSHNIKNLRRIAIKEFEKFTNKGLDIIVGTYRNGHTIMYQISPYKDFDIVTLEVRGDETAVYTAGIKTEECFLSAKEDLLKGYTLQQIYSDTFNKISYEGIGGDLIAYQIDSHGIKKVINASIKEKEDTKYFKDNYKKFISPHMIVAANLFGEVIGSEKLVITNTGGSFKVDGSRMTAKNMDLELYTNSGNSRIVLNPEEGIKIQGYANGTWTDKLYEDVSGNIVANNMTANYGTFNFITANYGTYNFINTNNMIATEMKTNDSEDYMIFHNQYTDFYRNGIKVMDIGIVENGSGNPVIDFYKPNGSAYFHIWGNGDSNFATIGSFNSSISAEGNWSFTDAKINGDEIAGQNWVKNYVAQHTYIPPTTG